MNSANAPSAHTGLFQAQISAVPHSSAPRPVIQANVSPSALNSSPVPSAVHHPLALSYSAPFAAPPPFEGIVDFTSSHAPTSGAAYPTHGAQYQTAQAPMSLAARTDSVDWKQSPFFTYRPNEVKHRKRTTRQQLKVLEETFHKTQKPDGNVRKALALQLNMTPRNVQVWFQNRRAKDKNLAKRASKLVEDGTELDSHATLESTSPTTPIPKAEASGVFSERSFEQCIDFVSSPNEYRHDFPFASSSTTSSSPATAHPDLNGSTSPVEELFNRKFEISSPPAVSSGFPQSQTASGSNIPSTVAHTGFSVEEVASQPIALPRNIFAPRKSLPHIRAPAFGQDLQHQRSTSTPSFISNVDTTSDLSLTTCASIDGVLSMYPQNNGQSVYGSRYPLHDRVRRMPSGPLPTTNYSFGMSSSQRETEHEFDPSSFGRYAQFNAVSGSNTPTSVSGFSQYQSSFEEDHSQAPYGWYPGRRGSSSQHVPSREFSPVSNGYSSGSPRPESSAEPETEAHDGAVYMTGRNEWPAAYAEEYKSNVITSPENKQAIGYQEIFGYNGLVDQNGMPISSEDGYLPLGAMTQTVANAAVYQPMMNGHSFVPQVPSYTSDNQTPMVGFNSTAPVGYNYA